MQRLFFLLFFCISAAKADVVLLRDSTSAINCDVISWSKEGLRISRSEQAAQEVISWHSIRDVEGESVGVGLIAHLQRGEMLWRAKTRLLRGDIALAAPLFREMYLQLKNADGEDAYLASEGLLRCNLAIGNLEDSVGPWLSVVDHLQANQKSQLQELSPIVDTTTFLCPHLPPVWNGFVVHKKLKSLTVKSEVARAYYEVLTSPIKKTAQPLSGPAFLQDVLFIMDSGDYTSTLEIEKLQEWQQVWFLYAQAIQLLTLDKQDEALLKFAEIAALHGKTQPWLAGASMFALSNTFTKAGKDKISKNIMNEFSRVLQNHPLRKEQ